MTDPTQGQPTGSSRPESGAHATDPNESQVWPTPVVAKKPAWEQSAHRRMPTWIAPAALAFGVIGTLLALWGIKIASGNAPLALAGDSKVRVCSAFAAVSKAVQLQTNGGAEPLPEALAATNARQALLGGGDYLVQQLDTETPRDLAEAVSAFADHIQVLGLNYLGGAVSTDPAQVELIKQADATMTQVADLCS